MRDDPSDSGRTRTEVRAALHAWRDSLVDLGDTNRLINFPTDQPDLVEIVGPEPESLIRTLHRGAECPLVGTGADPQLHAVMDDVLRTEMPDLTLDGSLRRMLKKARQEYLDRGVSVLHLVLGLLRWRDEEDTPFASPVLLVPVELVTAGPGDPPRLRLRDSEAVVNPALAIRLRRLGMEPPALDDRAEPDVSRLWTGLQSVVARRRGWHVERTVLLTCLTFHKEAIYRDLLANEDRILAHPVVQALATTSGRQAGTFRFAPVPPAVVDRVAPPEHVPLVLDADASQRACIAAAVGGHSFVMDGPPGTGKSQTIANMIGCLLHAGKRVLFVSEKAAALDVVHHRLVEAGLDRYVLELHGHKAGRKEVATALAAALDDRPAPVDVPDAADRRGTRERREQLSAYAAAMNEVRAPLGRTLHHVLGICARLEEAPAAPVPVVAPEQITPESVRRIMEATGQLATAWRTVVARDELPWRDVIRREPLDPALSAAESALAGLSRAVLTDRGPVQAFGLGGTADAGTLARLAAHAAKRPPHVRDAWLTAPGLDEVRQAAESLGRDLTAVRVAREAVARRAGVAWSALPDPAGLPRVPDLSGLVPAPVALDALTAAEADRQARICAEAADNLERHRAVADRVTARLGLPNAVKVADIDRVATIAELGGRAHRPEPFWFGPGVAGTVAAGAPALRRALENLVAAEMRARPFFAEAILTQPVDELADRFARVHRGWRKLLGAYRRDRRIIAAFVVPTAAVRDALPRLETAVAWQRARQDLAAAESAYGAALGRYWQGPGTDFAAIDEALGVVETALRAAPPAAVEPVAAYVCAPEPDHELIRLATEARDAVLAAKPALPDRLLHGPIDGAVGWLRANATALVAVAAMVHAYDVATGRTLDYAEVLRIVRLQQEVTGGEQSIAANAGRYTDVLGDAFAGGETDQVALNAAVAWAAATRGLLTGADRPLTAEQARALRGLRPVAGLERLAEQWAQARQVVLDAFAPARRAELEAELRDHERARAFLERIRGDADGQEEWFTALDARAVLSGHGLDPVVEFCADRRLDAGQVRPAVERALFRAWADAVIQADHRLRPWRSADRDRLVAEFRALDSRLAAAAAGDIAASVASRRPDTDSPAADLLRREAMKASRHLPVRDLIAQTRELVLGLRPCFLMSPLTVSQSLPPDIRFDVVIFDEASQVTPADAINCVYRGAALITAGDDRQLPPTSFFDRALGAGEEPEQELAVLDFESVLELAKGCGAFASLGLNWHYRSRHEALIAFSNHAFYSGRLSVFPSANTGGPDTGVALLPAGGVYRRSTSRDNPVEAERVAERIVHHFTTRPGLSLGVVTFSVAQAEAIERAVEVVAAGRPELERILDDDRLHGFFVKSLEAVQGDERDVMIFSIGYGFDEAGKISANFGALNRPNGWRRLNVAITRARYRVEIVTSILARDVPETDNEGVRLLASYLDYAERGATTLDVAVPALPADGVDGPFQESVVQTLRSWGYPVRTNLGWAGGRVDLGVRRPDRPEAGYLLGIRCDGSAYGGCTTARDRDRLSEQVLLGLGWNLHRIWSIAWYRDRAGEEARLRAALEMAAGSHRAKLIERRNLVAVPSPAGSSVPEAR